VRLSRASVYAGAMHEHYAGRQTGSLDMPGIGSLTFDLIAEPVTAWNPVVGAEIGVTRSIRANVEYGFNGRNQLMIGAGYRFGGK
jgi:opacity protein-like surface antigen